MKILDIISGEHIQDSRFHFKRSECFSSWWGIPVDAAC